MAEDSWLQCEREMFLNNYVTKPPMTDNMKKFAKTMLEKYNARIVRSLFGDSPYVAQNIKESIIKYEEAGSDGE